MADRYDKFSKKYESLMENIRSAMKIKNDFELSESSK